MRTGIADVVSTTTSYLHPLVLPRLLARSFLCSTEKSRTIPSLCRVFSLLTFAFSPWYSDLAFRVPTLDVSIIDLVVRIEKSAAYEEIEATSRMLLTVLPYKGITEYSGDQVVSTDFISHSASSIFDAGAGIQLSPNSVKLISWYDNEWGTLVITFVIGLLVYTCIFPSLIKGKVE